MAESAPEGGKAGGEEKVERMRIDPVRNSAFFGELRPDTDYRVGVVSYV